MPFFEEISRRLASLNPRRFENDPRVRAAGLTRWTPRPLAWLEDLATDLRYALRGLRRNPGFSLTAIVCLALGIGANTTIFSVAQEALFSRPGVRDPDSMLFVRVGGMSHIPMTDFRFLRNARVFDGLAGENAGMQANWRSGDVTSRVYTAQVTDNYFEVTGTPLAMGRGIQPGDADVAVVTARFWRQRLGADPQLLGRKLILDGRPFTVIGLLPAGHRDLFGFGVAHDLYIPVASDRISVSLYARNAGTPRPIVLGRLTAACRELDRLDPRPNKRAESIRMSPVSGIGRLAADSAALPVAAFFAMLMIVVGLLLLIACANVASLLLARASSRSQELAIRFSIGAARGRIVRQLLAESLLLGMCGAAAGLGINLAAVSLIAKVQLPLPIPIQLAVRPDWRLLAYTALVAVGSSLLAGVAPAFQGTRAGLGAALKRGERQVGGGWNLRNALVAVQLAVSIVLLCAGFIFTRNLTQASAMNPGFDLDHTVWASMRLVPEAYGKREKLAAFIDAALERLRATPGIESASILRVVPFNDEVSIGSLIRTDVNPNPVRAEWYQNDVSPDYFRTMGIALLAGRDFRRSDADAVIVNENVARRLFGSASPIGHTLHSEPLGVLTIVGVVRNSSYLTLSDGNALALYRPFGLPPAPGQHDSELHFMLRSAGRSDAAVRSVRSTLDRLDPTAALEVRPMHGALTFALLPSQAGALVLGTVGLLGLALAAVGLYGVLLYTVSRRIREIGLRVALGATPGGILRLVLRHSLGLVAVGIGAGMALAIVAVRPLAMFLIPNVRPTDPLNFGVVGAVLLAVAGLATVAPAVRALRVDPLTALRHE